MVLLRDDSQRGQILLETIISLGILVNGVLIVISMSLLVVQLARVSTGRVTAVNLAREGIELVRTVRDTNWLDPNNAWPYGLTSGNYIIDSISGDQLLPAQGNPSSVQACGTGCQLYLNSENRYVHTVTGTPSNFRRLIQVADTGGTEIKRIIAHVSWAEGNKEFTYKVETHMSNWRED